MKDEIRPADDCCPRYAVCRIQEDEMRELVGKAASWIPNICIANRIPVAEPLWVGDDWEYSQIQYSVSMMMSIDGHFV